MSYSTSKSGNSQRPGMLEGLGGPVRIDRSDFTGCDPALEECCQREAESNRRREAIESELHRHDRVALAERLRRNVIPDLSFGKGCRCCYDPHTDGGEYDALTEARERLKEKKLAEEEEEDEEEEEEASHGDGSSSAAAVATRGEIDSDSDDDSDFDYLLNEDIQGGGEGDDDDDEERQRLKEIEEHRRAELELAALRHEAAIQHGYGVHRQMHPSRVLRAAGLGVPRHSSTPPPHAVVLHLYDAESDMSASLDLFLESSEMAGTYRGTKFLRGSFRGVFMVDAEFADRVLPHNLRPDRDMPALVAVRDGVVVAVAPRLDGLGSRHDGIVDPGAVEEWLDRAGVLLRDIPPSEELCRIRPEEDALYQTMMGSSGVATTWDEKESAAREEEHGYSCGVPGCNKTFRHKHVGVKNEEQDGLVVAEEDAVGN